MEIKTGDLVKHRTNDFFHMVVTFNYNYNVFVGSDKRPSDISKFECTWLDINGHAVKQDFYGYELTRVNK